MEHVCGHCGRSISLEHKGDVQILQLEDEQHGLTLRTIVGVWYCTSCDEIVVYRFIWSDEIGESLNERLLYPTTRNNDSIPEKVRTRFEAAGKVRKIEPGLYAVGIRRMLETVCNEEGASGKDLFEKLDDLVLNDYIPAPLADAAHELRKLGNLGAHDDEIEIDAADVPAIDALADAILEYLYRAPAALNTVKTSLDARRANTETNQPKPNRGRANSRAKRVC